MKKIVFFVALLLTAACNGQTFTMEIDSIGLITSNDSIKDCGTFDSKLGFINRYHKKIPKHTPNSITAINLAPIEESMGWWDMQPPQLQLEKNKFLPGINRTNTVIGWSLMFISGVAHGYHETILNHYSKFKKIHPNANDQYYNPEISWTNKYKNNDPNQGPAFWQSEGALVGFTDFYHLTAQVEYGAAFSGGIVLTIGEKRKWYEYAIQIVGGMAIRAAGFKLIYDGIYK